MARRRLTPPAADAGAPVVWEGDGPVPRGVAPPAPPPIARVAAEAAAESALREVGAELASARAEGRLALRIPLTRIEAGWLMRDRLTPEDDDFAALLTSLRAHGQRVPVEVAEIGHDAEGPRYGLISGWRRLTALTRLQAETGEDRFTSALAVLRRPEGAAAAYLAMVEENEIRAGLSHYERARIVARAAEAGVYPGVRQALTGLFGAVSPARRSKIGAFVTLYRGLDGVLRFPAAIPERLGLSLARALEEDASFARRLQGRLARAAPTSPEAEQAVLAEALRTPAPAEASTAPAPPQIPVARPTPAQPVDPGSGQNSGQNSGGRSGPDHGRALTPGLFVETAPGRAVLSGPAVDAAFLARLEAWLRKQERH